MRLVTILDTSIATDNLGDEIIMDAVHDVVAEVLPDAYCVRVPTHDKIGPISREHIRRSDFAIVGGTNMLDSDQFSKGALWKVGAREALDLKGRVVLLGVGWRRYMYDPKVATRAFLNSVLSSEVTHSVRDSYAQQKLSGLSNKSILNTGCMTMWSLTPSACAKLPRKKSDTVVTTLTFYDPRPESDRKFIELLKAEYAQVAFWPQMAEDYAYFQSLGVGGVKIIDPSTRAYTKYIEDVDADFVGTRLHGGVRAMQKGRRALILAIDNRAVEIARDTNLPVVKRDDMEAIAKWIGDAPPTEIRLPQDAIDQWKAQFRRAYA